MELQEAIAVVRAEVSRRIGELQDLAGKFELLGDATGVRQLREALTPLALPPRTPVAEVVPQPDRAKRKYKISKYLVPVVEVLKTGPKRLSELERLVGKRTPYFEHVLKQPEFERADGLWQLSAAGREKYLEGKA